MKKLLRNPFVPWIATFVVLGATLFFYLSQDNQPRLQTLTENSLATAKTIWKERGPKSYDLDVMVTGIQQGTQHIEVRNGQVVGMTTDGVAVAEHSWKYWTVDGMFQFLDEELVQAKNPQMGFQISDPSKVYLSVYFDKEWGIPSRYLRQVFGRPLTIEWSIKHFETK